MFAEEGFTFIEAERANPFDRDSNALIDEIQNPFAHKMTFAGNSQIDGFANNMVGRHQLATALQNLTHHTRRRRMPTIIFIHQRIQAGSVQEHITTTDHKESDQSPCSTTSRRGRPRETNPDSTKDQSAAP